MNPNTVRASLSFSFKGETYELATVLDLDALAQRYDDTPPLHYLIAGQHDIDTESYLYEVMELEEIEFDQAEGAAIAYLHDQQFDFEGYFRLRAREISDIALQNIARQQMGIEELSLHPELLRALRLAYQLGQDA